MVLQFFPLVLLYFFAAFGTGPEQGPFSTQPRIVVAAGPRGVVLEVRQLPAGLLESIKRTRLNSRQWRRFFPVFTGHLLPEENTNKHAMLGSYTIDGGLIKFVPRFPFQAGMAYTATFRTSELIKILADKTTFDLDVAPLSFEAPAREHLSTTTVEAVYPSSDIVPANLLKFYIFFSSPMAEGNPHEFIHLYKGKEKVALPFVEVKTGLWDGKGQRLTLFFHPGRLKREVGPNLALGPILRAGGTYRLVVNSAMRDRSGNPLAETFEKEFRVVAADRESPEVDAWRFVSPAAGTRAPLQIQFDEALDQALALRFLTVLDPHGDLVDGEVHVGSGETVWRLAPTAPWTAGEYKIQINSNIEDLAGNRLGQLFEANLTREMKPAAIQPFVTKTFRIGPGGKS